MPSLLDIFPLWGNDNNAKFSPDITCKKAHNQKSNADVIVPVCCERTEFTRTVISLFCLRTIVLKLKTELKNPGEICFNIKWKLYTVFNFFTKLFI